VAPFTLSPGHPFPPGTAVKVYERTAELPGDYEPRGVAPVLGSGTVAADRRLTFNLSVPSERRGREVPLWVVGQVDGRWRWVRVRLPGAGSPGPAGWDFPYP
jgi:hypothetical protein